MNFTDSGNIITSEGAAKTTMLALMAGAILNIGLDPVFIYVLDMGVAGAAIATAISQIVSTLIYLTFVLRKKSIYHFKIKNCTFTKEIMSEIFKIGIPTLVFQILTSLLTCQYTGKTIRVFSYCWYGCCDKSCFYGKFDGIWIH